MTEVSKKEFLTRVNKSRVIKSKRLKEWLRSIETTDALDLAAKMVRDQLLTQWQAKYLMSGRTRLDLGSYRLLQRIQRDELGDRFLAIHNQLGRKVEIQVLPSDLTRDRQRCDAFIQKASLAATLDHPNLSHVYDIDQEGGRYFLVTEHLEGVTLDLAPRTSLNEIDIARVVQQTITGLKFAHENQVVHGDLTQSDLQLVNDRDIIIKNIAVSPLRSTSTDSDSEKVRLRDYQAIAQIGYSVLKEIPPTNGSSHRDSLTTMFRSLASGDADSIELATTELSDWWAEHGLDSSINGRLSDVASNDDELFDLSVSGDAGSEGEFDQPVASELSTSPPAGTAASSDSDEDDFYDDDFDDDDNEDDESPGWLTRVAHENPVSLMATAMVLALMFVAGGGYVAYSMIWKTDSQPIARHTSAKPAVTRNNDGNPENSDVHSTKLSSEPEIDLPPADFSDPEGMQRQIATALGTPMEETKPAENGQPETDAANPETNREIAKTTPAAQPSLEVAVATDPPAPVTPESETPKPDVAETIPAEPTVATQPAVLANPFEKFTKTTSLPALDDETELKIGDLVINNRFLLGAEIFVHEQVSRSKAMFTMDRDPTDNQKWIVTGKRNARDKGDPIATFRKSDSALFFQWMPAASSNKQAGYLQNCLIKLIVPGQSGWLKLRSPVMVEPMIITESDFSAQLEAELEFLPDPEIITVEILSSQVPETSFSPAQIEFQQDLPGRILLLPKDPQPFVWVQVDAAFKTRFKAQTEVKLYAAGRLQPVKNVKTLSDLEKGLKTRQAAAINEYNSKKDLRAPEGRKTQYDKAKAELLKASELAQVHAAQGSQYVQAIPKFFNQPIGIRIVAKMDGHEVEILNTKMPAK